MLYRILMHRLASKQLLKVPVIDRERIIQKLHILANNPDDSRLKVKKMTGFSGFRLRVGIWRIIYQRDDSIKVIEIQEVGARGDIYK